MLKAEGEQAHRECANLRFDEPGEAPLGLHRRQRRGVHDYVGDLLETRKGSPLVPNGGQNVPVSGGRVRSAALLVAPHQCSVVGLEEYDLGLQPLSPLKESKLSSIS